MNTKLVKKRVPIGTLFYGGVKEAKLELLVSNLIAKFKTPKANAAFFEINNYLKKQNVV